MFCFKTSVSNLRQDSELNIEFRGWQLTLAVINLLLMKPCMKLGGMKLREIKYMVNIIILIFNYHRLFLLFG